MGNITIREKLYDYIRFADDKKVKAIYTMVEDEIATKANPWDDPEFVAELDRRVAEYESGETNTPTWEEVKAKQETQKMRNNLSLPWLLCPITTCYTMYNCFLVY